MLASQTPPNNLSAMSSSLRGRPKISAEDQNHCKYSLKFCDSTSNSAHEVFKVVPRKHRKKKPVNRGFYENSRLCRVHELNLNDSNIANIPRGGVLFYTFIDGELHICFGRDMESRDLTDFGGTRRKKEDPIACAVREGNEESRKAFSEITPDQVQGFFCLYSSKMLIIFVPVASPDHTDIRHITNHNFENKEFLNQYEVEAKCFNEISEIVWLNEQQIDNLFSRRPNHQMFAKVRRFIYSCTEFSQSTGIMKNILREAVKIDEWYTNALDKTSSYYLPSPEQPAPTIYFKGNRDLVRARPSISHEFYRYDPVEGVTINSFALDCIYRKQPLDTSC